MKTIVGITNSLTENELSQLDSFVSLYNKISHQLYVDLFIKKLSVKDLSPAYQTKYSISKRHFDSIRKILEGKVSSILALNKNYILDTKDKIKSIEKDLSKQTKTYNSYKDKYKKEGKLSLIETNLKFKVHNKIVYNYIRLDRLKAKLLKLEYIRDTGNVRLCFGSNKITDKYINLNFKVDYEVETLKQIIINNQSKNKELWQALTYKLIKQPNKSHNKDKYVVSISFEKHLIKQTYTSKDNGCIGVDINQDHLAVSNLDKKGNLLNIYTYEYDLNGSKHQNNNSISLAVKELMLLSTKLNKPIVIEQLDFSAKRKSLKAGINKTKNKQLSSFAYSKIIELIKARAEDHYIEVREVNPAYTSMIGKIKYSSRSRISVHHGAAMCIGRKGLFNKYNDELKIIKEYKEKRISNKNRQIKSINLPVRSNLNSVVYWKELKKIMVKDKQHERESSSNVASQSTSLRNSNEPVMKFNVISV